MGQIVAAWIGFQITGLPTVIHMPLAFLLGALAGGLWAALPGYLKAKLGVHEVINTIMMNYIALYFSHYLLMAALKEPGQIPKRLLLLLQPDCGGYCREPGFTSA